MIMLFPKCKVDYLNKVSILKKAPKNTGAFFLNLTYSFTILLQ